MPIPVECPDCSRPYDIPDRYAGQKVRCKSCGTAMPVPKSAPEPVGESDQPFHFTEPVKSVSHRDAAKKPAATSGSKLPGGNVLWWLIGGSAAFVLVLLVVSFLTPLGILIAIGLFALGMLVLFAGQILLIVTAFQEDATQGLLVFFVPIYPLFYLFSRWPKTSNSVWLYAAGAVVALLSIPTGAGGMFATAQWAAGLEKSPDDSTIVAGGPAGDPQFGEFTPPGMPDPNGFPQQPGFPPPGLMPPGGMPPGAMPPGAMPPGAMPPGMFPQDFPQNPPGAPRPVAGDPPGGLDSAASDEPVAMTFYMRRTNSYFDRTVDFKTAAEERLSEIDGYVADSVEFDFAKGVVTLKAKGSPLVLSQTSDALRRIGLATSVRPSSMPWVDPTRPRTVTLTIRSTLPAYDDLTDVDGTVDELFSEVDGYVPGSIDVDVDAMQVTYEAFPGSRAERFPTSALLRAGIHTAPPSR